jgi:hypothetical protein
MALLAMLLAGCSGSGVSVEQSSGASLQALATDHMSALALFFGWLDPLYPELPTSWPPPNWEFLPDGTFRLWGTTSDGGQFEWFTHPDGSGDGSIQWPDGSQFTQANDAPVYNDDFTILQVHIVNTYPNGAQIETNLTSDYGGPAFHQTSVGTAALPGEEQMQFTWDRIDYDRDLLNLQLPDGTSLTLTIPITTLPGKPYWPRFGDTGDPSGPPTGILTVPGHGELRFWVTGSASWSQWRFLAADGTEATLALDEDHSGSGQIKDQYGQTVGALSWTAGLAGTLSLVGAGTEDVSPSAAAQAFRLDQWVRNTALLGPAPVY